MAAKAFSFSQFLNRHPLMGAYALAIGMLLFFAPGWADDPAPAYTLTYSQISAGAAQSGSAAYSTEDTLRYANVDAETQRSVDYTAVNPVGTTIKANNGIVIADGTKVHIQWPEARHHAGERFALTAAARNSLQGAEGYNVYRSNHGEAGSYVQINATLVLDNQYTDEGLSPGIYYYRVYFINAEASATLWTFPLMAIVTGDTSPAHNWSIYE